MAASKLIKVILLVVVLLVINLLYSLSIIDFISLKPSGMLVMNYLTKFGKQSSFKNSNESKFRLRDNKINEISTRQDEYIDKNLKYILQWTSATTTPFVYMGEGRSGFIERNCTYTNCYVTHDRKYLGLYANFDLILFAGPQLNLKDLPKMRSAHQKYGFVSIESADNYQICQETFDNFFNWTLTYRLDSDSRWGYMVIRNARGEIVGPNEEMHWIKSQDMVEPVDQNLRNILKNKSKAAAWFVTNCSTKSKREIIAETLKTELVKYNLTLDIYGKCGNLKCSRKNDDICNNMLEKDYYFYLSFENSFDKDYATEKLLRPLKHNVVPIVYGGANYTSFMPEGIYLDVEMGTKELAATMNYLINHPDEYEQYFRWKKYYSYHSKRKAVETDDYCSICALLNDVNKVKTYSNYKNFREWWNVLWKC